MRQRSMMHAVFATGILLLGAVGAYADHGGTSGGDGGKKTEVRLRTKLSGAAIQDQTPGGNADFRSDSRGRTRLNVEVEHVNLPAGTVLTVSVQHGATVTPVGSITLAAAAENELELDSQDGDVVPAVQTGDMVTVSNAGATILAGAF
jgi:hypothetical protein